MMHVICTKEYYNGPRIDKAYRRRWEIEVQFKNYKNYKQYINLGKSQYRKLGSIQLHLYCVAIAGLLIALYCCQHFRKLSFKKSFKHITSLFYGLKLQYKHLLA
jgi:IS4 transposase